MTGETEPERPEGREELAAAGAAAYMQDDRLRQYVHRIERISAEIAALHEDRKDIYAEAKAVGYDAAVLRMVIARRAAPPEVRAEADAMVAAYEAALGGAAPDPAVDRDEAAREMAVAMLAEQVEGITDPSQASALVEHVAVILDIRAEIGGLREMEKSRKAMANAEGFDKPALTRVVRWIEKCAKHGVDAMRAGEAVFHLYRGTLDARGVAGVQQVTGDPKLQRLTKAASARPVISRLAWHDVGDR